jgi:hypothetical protein
VAVIHRESLVPLGVQTLSTDPATPLLMRVHPEVFLLGNPKGAFAFFDDSTGFTGFIFTTCGSVFDVKLAVWFLRIADVTCVIFHVVCVPCLVSAPLRVLRDLGSGLPTRGFPEFTE